MACIPLSSIIGASDFQAFENFFTPIYEGFADMAEDLATATSDIAFKINEAQKFLEKAECLGFLKGLKNPVIKSFFNTIEVLNAQLQAVEDARDAALNFLNDGIKDVIEGIVQTVVDEFVNKGLEAAQQAFGQYLDEVRELQAAVKLVDSIVQSAKSGLNKAAEAISCITGEELSEEQQAQLLDINEQIDAINDIIDTAAGALGIVDDILTGEFCIDAFS